MLKHCQESNLSLGHEKCKILLIEGVVLCHHIYITIIRVELAKVEVINQLSIPRLQKDVWSILGHAGYYRQFIKKFTKIDTPLFKLLAKDGLFSWDSYCEIYFDILKKISAALVLRGPNWSLPFHIQTDRSDIYLGVVLGKRETRTLMLFMSSVRTLLLQKLTTSLLKRNFYS